MSKTMAEVLADKLAELDELTDGDGFTYSWFDMEKIDLAEELMLALSATGFGLVADTKAEALEEAADGFARAGNNVRNSTYVEGEGAPMCEAQDALLKLAFELEIQWGAGKLDLPKLKGLAAAKCTGHDTPSNRELLGTSGRM